MSHQPRKSSTSLGVCGEGGSRVHESSAQVPGGGGEASGFMSHQFAGGRQKAQFIFSVCVCVRVRVRVRRWRAQGARPSKGCGISTSARRRQAHD